MLSSTARFGKLGLGEKGKYSLQRRGVTSLYDKGRGWLLSRLRGILGLRKNEVKNRQLVQKLTHSGALMTGSA
jgi:hypothetical protein